MAISIQEIIPGSVLGITPAIYYVGLNAQSAQIQQLVLYNSDSANAHIVNIWFAGSSGTPGSQDKLGAFTVPAGATLSVYQAIRLVIPTGGTIQAQADTAGTITIKASANIITS